MAGRTPASTTYRISAKGKKQNGDTTSSITRNIADIGNADFIADPDNAEALLRDLQPLITDTLTGFTIVKEDTYQFGEIFGTVQAGINEWEDELTNMKLVNVYTDGDDNKKESINRPSTNATPAMYKSYAQKRAEAYGSNYDALYGDVLGTSDTKVWVAD